MFTCPAARRTDVVDDYHGTLVADPYRWLEDPTSDETAVFVAGQNALTLPYLGGLPMRARLAERMTALWNTPKTYLPTRRSGVTVWAHNSGLTNQPVYYVERGDNEARFLLDPNTLSDDGTVAINVATLSPDGSTFSYAISDAGSDWQVIRFRDTETGDDLTDEIRHVKFTSIAWYEDGFFYARFPETDLHAVTTANNPSVCFHALGTSQDDDTTVFNNADDPNPGYDPTVTHDGRYLVLHDNVGTSRHNGLLYKDLLDPHAVIQRLVEPLQSVFEFLIHDDGAFVVRTDVDAPNGRIVAIPLTDPSNLVERVAETSAAIELAAASAGHLVTVRITDGSHRIDRYSLDGAPAEPIALPGLGSVSGVTGRYEDDYLFIGYQSFTEPPIALIADDSGTRRFVASDYEPAIAIDVTRTSATSSDRAAVGMFVLRAAGTTGPAPTDLYGYGGFSINMTPIFNPSRIAFLEAGGVVVVANLRGGVELGEAWHEAGRLGKKQQVFDDFIACA
jgi:prolyl oligopeptidase